ncbi:ATP-binding protein [Streptomyces coelicoflavus]|uniref:ATP-binding protein n=1 Tax=Streptomyces coelicoflavus TaxID=285562 RepID=A0A7K3PQL3_9ACTN|nr:ATP-binding protein [Streptomyces coelicoflavus]NEB12252.1 ATP-binding protein [Streptomyces coelicoflavus]
MNSTTSTPAPLAGQDSESRRTRPSALGFDAAFASERCRVANARRMTTSQLRLWRVPESLTADVVVIVSELVTNAIQHRCGDIKLRVQCSVDRLLVEVSDQNSAPARMRPVHDEDTRGRGLHVVDQLAMQWGVSDDGLTTWAACGIPVETPR